MKHYKLRYVMHEPSEDTEDKYMAEIPSLPRMQGLGRYTGRRTRHPPKRGCRVHRGLH